MDGDTQPKRSLDRRLLFAAFLVALIAAALWASTSLAGGSGSPSPAKAKVSQVDRGPAGLHSGGTGGSKDDCPERGNVVDTSDV
jgi:hypothetical protein